jgi:hypothetical protein
MDTVEARAILERELTRYRAVPFAELAGRIGAEDCYVRIAPSGVEYQLEVQFFRDSKDTIVVVGSIDDGGLRAFFPLCSSFIMARDGTIDGVQETVSGA